MTYTQVYLWYLLIYILIGIAFAKFVVWAFEKWNDDSATAELLNRPELKALLTTMIALAWPYLLVRVVYQFFRSFFRTLAAGED